MGRIRPNLRLAASRVLRCALISVVVAVMVPVGVPVAHAAPTTYWVDITNGDNTHLGTLAEPFRTITYAASQAGPADTIMVQPGTYSGGAGEIFPIALGGESLVSVGGVTVTSLQGTGQLLSISGWQDGDRLEGFTVTTLSSTACAVWVATPGAGTSSANAPVIRDCIFSGSTSSVNGAGLSAEVVSGSFLKVEDNGFRQNSAVRGAGLYATVAGNLAVRNNSFILNDSDHGGAVFLDLQDAGVSLLEGNEFINNTALIGGAIVCSNFSSAAQTLRHNNISANSADISSGGIYFNGGTVVVHGNEVAGNTSANDSGFAHIEGASVLAESNYISQNSAPLSGSAWGLESGSLVERNDTVVGNIGIGNALVAVPSATVTIVNSIYWNPSCAHELYQVDSVSFSCSRDDAGTLALEYNTVGAGMVYADPAFDADNLPGVLADSPCIEAGTSESYGPDDFFGRPCPQDFDGNRVAVPDIGCYEAPGVPLPVLSPIYRFYNVKNGTHFYTDSASERDHVMATWPTVYSFEGAAYYTYPSNNTQPLTRLYNKVSGSHFYTASPAEAANALAKWPTVFSLDGLTYAVNPGPVKWSTPVHRFYNKKNGSHFYTASEEERLAVIAKWPDVYSYEGPAFWIGQ
jgi:hypothetical protein